MKWPSVEIDNFSNLLVRIITIGYEKKGESIIVLLKDKRDNTNIYSLVIDSYHRKKQNRTIELLKENNVDCLDLLCWSHPDDDHSLGINDILDQFCNNSTRVITPISFWSGDYAIKAFNANRREVEFVNHLREINKRTKCCLHPMGIPIGGHSMVDQRIIHAGIDEISFTISAVSPFVGELKGIIDSHIDDPVNNRPPSRNQTSVSLLLEIGEYRMLFAADLPNDEIEMMNEDKISRPIFLKIPHHGSESSKKMLDYIVPGSNMLACTTVYKSTKPGSDLPHEHIIKNYARLCEMVFCTGSHPAHNCSTITADFDLFDKFTCKIKSEGSAERILRQ